MEIGTRRNDGIGGGSGKRDDVVVIVVKCRGEKGSSI